MIITASQKYIRVSPQKVKFVADSVKSLGLVKMREHLGYLNNEPARKLLATLNQGIANAKHNYNVEVGDLELDTLLILRGPQYKRQRARSRGQGHSILKRTTHIIIKLKQVETKKPVEEVKEVAIKKVAQVKTKKETSRPVDQ